MSDYRVEVRPNDDGTIDEVLLYDGERCLFHLEQMGKKAYWFALYPVAGYEERASFWMRSKKKRLILTQTESVA